MVLFLTINTGVLNKIVSKGMLFWATSWFWLRYLHKNHLLNIYRNAVQGLYSPQCVVKDFQKDILSPF